MENRILSFRVPFASEMTANDVESCLLSRARHDDGDTLAAELSGEFFEMSG